MNVNAFAVIPHSDVKGVSIEMEIKPIIMCKYCKHWFGPDDGETHSCDVDALLRPGEWFCPAGEWRDGE